MDLKISLLTQIKEGLEILKPFYSEYSNRDSFNISRIENFMQAEQFGMYYLMSTGNGFTFDTPFCDQLADCTHIDQLIEIDKITIRYENYFGPLISGCGCCDHDDNFESLEEKNKLGCCSLSFGSISNLYNLDLMDEGENYVLPINNVIEMNKYVNSLIVKYKGK